LIRKSKKNNKFTFYQIVNLKIVWYKENSDGKTIPEIVRF